MPTEPVVVLSISDSGSASLGGLTRERLHLLADTLRRATQTYAPDAKVLTRFDVRISDTDATLVVDLPAHDVVLAGRSIGLSRTEFEIFSRLVRHPRVVFGRHELAVTASGRSVDVHLSRVRTKLGKFGALVTTVRGAGYRFDPTTSVRVITEPARLRTA